MVAFIRKAFHPDAVCDQQMIECAVDGAEEKAEIEPVFLVAQLGGPVIEQFVGPLVVIGKHLKVLFHDFPP
ncbi:Hypothetical protein BROD_1583 [Brucella sp. NF 2653]|nr:Hypothetical protein BROD_1583 [Brucella sp. NF 2653]